jgi:Kdo2-lipid IVA lauroyltransferase/acyltransferase
LNGYEVKGNTFAGLATHWQGYAPGQKGAGDSGSDRMRRERPATRVEVRMLAVIAGCMQFIGRLPPSMARKVGNWLGDAGFRLDRKHRRITLDNLAFALGDKMDRRQRQCLARSVFRNLGQILFEVGWSLSASPAELNQQIHIEGAENYHDALKKGRGVLAITAHLGNWELLPVVADRLKMTINVVYRPLDFMPLELFFNRLRTRFGAKLIPRRQAMLKIVRALRAKQVVAILIDQSADWYDGVWVDFFGRPTCTNFGVAMIAQKTRAPVLPVFLYREEDGFRAVFGKQIPLVVTGDRRSDIDSNTSNYSKAIENGIRRHIDQWFWVHRRWKNKPYQPWPRSQA